MRKTKIVCTLGPAVDSEEMLSSMIDCGMDVARFNFSHGNHEEQLGRLNRLKKVCKEKKTTIAYLLDTKGPEIRTGTFENPPVFLKEGEEVLIVNEDVLGNDKRFSVSYKELHKDVKPGTRILIDDGLIELEVLEVVGKDIRCLIKNQGNVSNYKSINVPDTSIQLPALTERDINDLRFGVENDFDFVAASFIRKADDVLEIRAQLDRMGGSEIKIISKIENREGVNNFEDILKVSDGIMVARGDLGVEIPAYEVPQVQKRMIRECYRYGKPVITATQMLDSMIRNPRPTRAEVSDVANAILDGTSAIMLSGETANGKYPLEAIKTMNEVAINTEKHTNYWSRFKRHDLHGHSTLGHAIAHACCTSAMDLNAKAIVAVSISGRAARMISRFRPACPVIATASSEKVVRQLRLSWGILPYLVDGVNDTDEVFELGKHVAVKSGIVKEGDVIVISAGTPVGISGTTNTLRIVSVGDYILQGEGKGNEKACAEVLNLSTLEKDCLINRGEKYILVAKNVEEEHLPLLDNVAGIVVEANQMSRFLEAWVKEKNVPVIYNCKNAVSLLSTGKSILMDPQTGIIS